MSLSKLAVALPRLEVNEEAEVVSDSVWHVAHPMALNKARPLDMEAAPPGVFVEGVGWSRNRMNNANPTTSLAVPRVVVLKLVWSSGVGLIRQLGGKPVVISSPGSGRSCVKASLLTPISTL